VRGQGLFNAVGRVYQARPPDIRALSSAFRTTKAVSLAVRRTAFHLPAGPAVRAMASLGYCVRCNKPVLLSLDCFPYSAVAPGARFGCSLTAVDPHIGHRVTLTLKQHWGRSRVTRKNRAVGVIYGTKPGYSVGKVLSASPFEMLSNHQAETRQRVGNRVPQLAGTRTPHRIQRPDDRHLRPQVRLLLKAYSTNGSR
jgi:hypothetical protein